MASRWTVARLLCIFALIPIVGCASSEVSLGHRAGIRGFELPEIRGATRIGERFNMPGGTVAEIDLQPVRVGDPKGTVRIELWPLALPGVPPLRLADVKVADFVRDPIYRFAFAPLEQSAGLCCYLEISSSASDPAAGVSLWANREPSRDGDGLIFNGRPRWAQLAFETHVAPPPLPRLRPAAWAAIAALAASWIAVGFLIRELPRAA